MGRILRKWEYIAHRLREEKAPKGLINIAERFDKLLVENYKLKTTMAWKNQYRSLNSKGILAIVSSGAYCVACMEDEDDCKSCKFGKRFGECYLGSSQFAEFYGHKYFQKGGNI